MTRRSLFKYAAGITALLALPEVYAPRVAEAVAAVDKPVVLWLAFQDCAGDTESFLRAANPGVADLILDLISVDYHETLMSPAGAAAEQSLADSIAQGGYLLVVEGSVPTADGGIHCTVGGDTARNHLSKAAKGAAAVIAVGTCSAYGGLPAASPNPTGAVGIGGLVGGKPVLNLPGCPVNVDNLTATIAHYLTFKALPARDDLGRPLFAYGDLIHDNCPRRGHFDSGEFALAFGDEGHRKGYCLYKLGCKGPATMSNCPRQMWNGGTSWPIGAGAPCVGCTEPEFWDRMTPIYRRLPRVPGFGVRHTAEQIGMAAAGAMVAGAVVHGVVKGGQHFANRKLDAATNPDRATAGPVAPAGRPSASTSEVTK
ncbi:MAG: hydrogenase small subunit [Actinomycetia bacterium]|nr:hydrogenase small subunit [Actinomycetes bacterium]